MLKYVEDYSSRACLLGRALYLDAPLNYFLVSSALVEQYIAILI